MTDSSIPDIPTFADALSPLERAPLGLQVALTVFEIGLLTFPEEADHEKREKLTASLLDAIKARRLHADGNPDGCRPIVVFPPDGKAQIKGEANDSPLSCALRHQGTRRTLRREPRLVEWCFGSVWLEEQAWGGDNCLVEWVDYLTFLETPAARSIPKPNWRAYPRLSDTLSYADAKARLGATDADMCAWTLDRGFRPNDGLVAYQQFNGRLSEFDWSNAVPDLPWLDQLAVLRFSRAEVEHFQPDPDPARRYLTCLEAVERVQKTHPQLSRASVESRLTAVSMAKPGELNLDLVARDPLAAKRELNRETLSECLFIADQIDQFTRECGDEQGAAPAPSAPTLPPGEPDRPEQGAAESPKRKRVDALAEAIEAALEVLSPDGRLPTPARLFEYLLTQDATGVVIPGDSKKVFYWIASNGNKQSADISTIAKRLDRMKQGD